jgi:hypothetical protein
MIIVYILKYRLNSEPSINHKKEGFTIKKCPFGLTTYITDDGDTNCCSGEVINNFCENIFCSLSPGSRNNCTTVMNDERLARNFVKCSPAISGDCSYYFTNANGSLQGCSNSPTTPDGTGPSDLAKPYCRIYDTPDANISNFDSCSNYVQRFNAIEDLARCRGTSVASTSNPVASANPTGYVIYGGGIEGQLPVSKIIVTPQSDKLYFAQDGTILRVVRVNRTYTEISASFSFPGNISYIDDYNAYEQNAVGKSTDTSYNIMKSDGTGTLTFTRENAYVIYGDGIAGNLPVGKVIISPQNERIYLAQDNLNVRIVLVNNEYTKNIASYYIPGNINNFTNYDTLIQYVDKNRPQLASARYNIKKTDGSGILLSAPAANTPSYVIYGDGISGNLPVTKIIDVPVVGAAPPAKLYLAQDGSMVRYVVTDTGYTINNVSRYFSGNLSEITDFATFSRITTAAGFTAAKYNIKKADGSGILLAQ